MPTSKRFTPEISVIVPVYDVEGYAGACITSLRAQTWQDFEAIIIDDGSTDGSADEIRDAIGGDPRFRVIRQDNQGLSKARNTGLDQARGAFIAFVDGDDRVAPDYLQRLLTVLREDGGDWVACAMQSCFPDGTVQSHSAIHGAADLGQHPVPRRYALDSWSNIIRHFPSAWNKLYRRELIGDLRFDEGTWYEDHSFYQQLATRTDKLLHLPEPLYLQTRGREGQITTTDDERVFQQFTVLDRLHDIMQSGGKPDVEMAFSRIASRLLFERSTALRDPERRARFAARTTAFFQDHALEYSPDWAADIGQAWALEMTGTLPLSVILPWNGRASNLLSDSLSALAAQEGPGYELVIVCDNAQSVRKAEKIAAPLIPGVRVIKQPSRGVGAARNHGLAAARGRFVTFQDAGDTLQPYALLSWTEAMLRHDADLGLSQFQIRSADPDAALAYSDGFHNTQVQNVSGPVTMTPEVALSVSAYPPAKIFRRMFLIDNDLRFATGPRPEWPLILGAALLAQNTVYSAWAGVQRSDHPRARRLRSTWTSPSALWRGHRALLHTLPSELAARLPDGWERRLFARALRDVAQNAPSDKLRMALTLSGAVLAAWACGISGVRPRAAGLDPAVGPRSSMLLDPAGLAGALIRRPRHTTLYQRQMNFDALRAEAAGLPMLYFPLQGQGTVRLRASFQTTGYANLSFYGADRSDIPVHLSLRHEEGLAVFNTRGPDGIWQVESCHKLSLAPAGVDVALDLSPTRVRIEVAGQEVFDLQKTEMGVIEGITWLELQGDIQILDLSSTPVGSGAGLTPGPRLSLRAPTDISGAAVTHLDATIPLIPIAGASGQALLPGWVWSGLAPDAPLQLRPVLQTAALATTAPPHPELTITRDEMRARLIRILELAQSNQLQGDNALAMTVLEHLRFGNFLSTLPGPARRSAFAMASEHNLDDFLSPPPALSDTGATAQAGPETEPDPEDGATEAEPSQDIDGARIAEAVTRLTLSQRHPSPPDPLSLLPDLIPPGLAAPGLFLALSEFFCDETQDFDGFFTLAERTGGLPLVVADDTWARSAALPFLYLEGRTEELRDTLWQLVEARDGWVVTPAMSWVARRALYDTDLSADDRNTLLYGFMEFVTRRTTDYWERSHCQALTQTAALMLRASDSLPDFLSDDIARFCLAAYGLSQVFWDSLGEVDDADLPPKIRVARSAFSRIAHATDSPTGAGADATTENALRFFEQAGTAEVPRIRRDLFGPAGVPLTENAPPALSALTAQKGNPALPALRYMASPGSAPVEDALSDMVARHLPALYTDPGHAPTAALQTAAARAVAGLLDDGPAGPGTTKLEAALAHCARVADGNSGHLGFALGLSLISGLSDGVGQNPAPADAEAVIAQVADWLYARHNALEAEAQTIADAPAVRMALTRLCADGALPELATELRALLAPDADLPALPQDNAGLPEGSPVYDTLVTVFSCKPYLDTRIPALRKGWLKLLEGMGIPYVVVVGDGDGRREGDVVYLDAPDDYEGLPQKTLATIRWVHDNTRFAHMLKIDDDCFVNAPLFFAAQSYRKFDYYGRRLTRVQGQMDRGWHQEKSSSLRGRSELDKSPEPSTYADGGSGYALSRTAMAAALRAAASPDGQRLISLSFMEDKLLGDLLVLEGIWVADEDYRTSIRRRTFGKALPVAYWNTSFHPSASAPVHQVHMDTHEGQQELLDGLARPGLRPAKIWPSYQEVQLGYQSNALELISDEARVAKAQEAEVALVACMRNEMFMLPHFLDHYRRLGVGAFLIADNASDDGTREYLVDQPDVALFSVDTDYKLSRYGVAWQQALLSAFRVGRWSIVADADELLTWQADQRETLPELLKQPAFDQADAARIFMLDMYPRGPLEDAGFTGDGPFAEARYCDRVPFLANWPGRGPYSDLPTWTSALRHRLIPSTRADLFVAQKIALLRYRPWMRLSAGLHFVGGTRLATRDLLFAHFKYNSDFRRKAQTEVARRQHFNDAEEYRKYLALASEGRSVIHDPELSVPWTDSPFVQAILRGDQPL